MKTIAIVATGGTIAGTGKKGKTAAMKWRILKNIN